MNDTFSFNRFAAVLKKDFADYIRRLGITMLLCVLVSSFFFWIISVVYHTDVSPNARMSMMVVVTVLAVMAAPSRVYGKANKPCEGVTFAMLPASALEKFLSMFVLCSLLTPVVCYAGNMLVDALLTLLPLGGFHDFVAFPDVNLTTWTFAVLWFLLISSFFMFGNMLFKNLKLGKLVLAILAFLFVVVCMSQSHLFLKAMETLATHSWMPYVVLIALDAAFYYCAFLRIKHVRY